MSPPTLLELAKDHGVASKVHCLSLGQGQEQHCQQLVLDGARDGDWVYLANCHLNIQFMPILESLIQRFMNYKPNQHFRLILSSHSHPSFPQSVINYCTRVALEPPKGIKQILTSLYSNITTTQISVNHKQDNFCKLTFSLAFFHSIISERHKFKSLGWADNYTVTPMDFNVCVDTLCFFINQYDKLPWPSIRYLVSNIIYGGYISNDFDARLMHEYVHQYFNEHVVSSTNYRFCDVPGYTMPHESSLSGHLEHIAALPTADPVELFGQSNNAYVLWKRIENVTCLSGFTTLHSHTKQHNLIDDGNSAEILEYISEIYRKLPDYIDMDLTASRVEVDPSPINNLLLNQAAIYNEVLKEAKKTLASIEDSMSGLRVMSRIVEDTLELLDKSIVPIKWKRYYPSEKTLAPWLQDLTERVNQILKWSQCAHPPTVFWISGLTNPRALLSCMMQMFAKQNNLTIDNLALEYVVQTVDDTYITSPPKEGIYVNGLYLQGASWDKKSANLADVNSMKLVTSMPAINVKVVEKKKKSTRNHYDCPVYYCPSRSSSAVCIVELKCASTDAPSKWLKRATALLLST